MQPMTVHAKLRSRFKYRSRNASTL
jgi:hypothetical protein